MYQSWKSWLSLNSTDLATTVLVVACLAFLGMLMRWSL